MCVRMHVLCATTMARGPNQEPQNQRICVVSKTEFSKEQPDADMIYHHLFPSSNLQVTYKLATYKLGKLQERRMGTAKALHGTQGNNNKDKRY